MSSLNGDVTIVRNGRSTSQVSIYNYPEHLNPFYEEDNHKRLRFWKLGRNGDNSGRRSSFSIGSLKDVWSFKSFHLKKKSSTLGINKTSESPPPLRREVSYDPLLRHTHNNDATVPNGSNNFLRSTPLRNSLQPTHHPQVPDESGIRFGLNRNDRYRSTIQTGGKPYSQEKQTSATSKKYIYGGSATPQPLRNSEFGRSESLGIISRGSSQVSVYSTNPFESDIDENDVTAEIKSRSTSIPKKVQRVKRHAPAPPVSIDKLSTSEKAIDIDPGHKICLEGDQSLTIIELTAEIENFVNTSNSDANNLDNASKQKVVSKSDVDLPSKMSNEISTKEIRNVVKVRENEQYDTLEKKRTNVLRENAPSNKEEIGHIECIHVHLDTPNSTSENNEPSKVTSFKQISSITSDKVKKTQETYESNKIVNESEGKELLSSLKLTTKIDSKEEKIDTDHSMKRSDYVVDKIENVKTESRAITSLANEEIIKPLKPPLAVKPNISKTKIVPESPISKSAIHNTNNDLVITEKKLERGLYEDVKFGEMPPDKLPSDMPNPLKIIESQEFSSALPISKSSKNLVLHSAAVNNNQMYPIDLMYRPKHTSHLEWKTSTLATLETNVPAEKRKSVKDIIESINRCQKLLGASAKSDQTSHNSLSLLSNNEKQHNTDEGSGSRSLKHNTQTQSHEPNNDLNQNLRFLDESQKGIQRKIEKITFIDNSHVGKISNTCNDNLNERSYRFETITNNEHIKKENNDVFQKCKINKEVYTNRESSPTASNLDWNPVPKPKRAINTPSPELKGCFNDNKEVQH